jgi:hypothetical protein
VNLRQTIGAHRKPGDIQQRQAANPAVRRKQDGEETLGGPAGQETNAMRNLARNNRRPCCNTISPESVLATAEDSLLISSQAQSAAGRNTALLHCTTWQYNGGSRC